VGSRKRGLFEAELLRNAGLTTSLLGDRLLVIAGLGETPNALALAEIRSRLRSFMMLRIDLIVGVNKIGNQRLYKDIIMKRSVKIQTDVPMLHFIVWPLVVFFGFENTDVSVLIGCFLERLTPCLIALDRVD
jgi:hypothetical protein